MNRANSNQYRPSFKEAILNKRIMICVFTGFTSGLPLFIIYQLVPYWLRKEGVGLAEIGLFSLVGFAYTWKFLWSPLMDRYVPPFLGRRRGWMLLTQLATMLAIVALGMTNPHLSIWSVAVCAVAVSLFSASQDIVIDAYRRELLPDEELGLGNAIHVQAYRLASLVPGSLGLILSDHIPWSSVYLVMAAFMLVGIILTLVIREAVEEPQTPKTLQQAVVEPFDEFINRAGWGAALQILAFMFFYKLGDNMATALSSPFYVDLGFDGTDIGVIAKGFGLSAVVIGGIVGGISMIKLGINRALWVFGVVQMVSILGFAVLAELGANKIALAAVISFENFGIGLGTAAFVAFIARATTPAYAATQFALFTALAALPRTLANAATGVVVEYLGWTNFFLLCTVLAIPGMLLLFKVAPWNEGELIQEEKASAD